MKKAVIAAMALLVAPNQAEMKIQMMIPKDIINHNSVAASSQCEALVGPRAWPLCRRGDQDDYCQGMTDQDLCMQCAVCGCAWKGPSTGDDGQVADPVCVQETT